MTGARSQCPANGRIARPFVGAHQHQIAQVNADYQQNSTHGRQEKHQRASRSTRHLLLEWDQTRTQIDLHVTPRVGDSGRHLRLGSRRIRAGGQPDQGRKIELADATQFCPVEAHWLKDLSVLGKLI